MCGVLINFTDKIYRKIQFLNLMFYFGYSTVMINECDNVKLYRWKCYLDSQNFVSLNIVFIFQP